MICEHRRKQIWNAVYLLIHLKSEFMNRKFIYYFIACMLMTLFGCDRTVFYQFQVKNSCSFDIIVDYSISNNKDSLMLEPNKDHLLFTETRMGKPTDFVGEEMYPFSYIRVLNTESIPVDKNFYRREFWKFTSNDSAGIYLLEIRDSDF